MRRDVAAVMHDDTRTAWKHMWDMHMSSAVELEMYVSHFCTTLMSGTYVTQYIYGEDFKKW